MKIKTVIMLACAGVAMNVWAASADTVKVINHPDKVSVVEKNGSVSLEVTGYDGDASKSYNYTIKHDKDGNVKSTETESRNGRYGIILNKKEDNNGEEVERNFEVFISGFYLGWGHTNAQGEFHGKTGKTFEVGILNVIGSGYKFGDRNRLSLGVGYQAKYYELKKDYYFTTSMAGGVLPNPTIVSFPDEYKRRFSQMVVHTIQFPLLYAKGFGNRFWAYAGGVMNWNCYAYTSRNYKVENTRINEMTTGLHQRKITFDMLVGIQHNGWGVYFRYSPQSVLKKCENTPVLNKTWTIGLALGF